MVPPTLREMVAKLQQDPAMRRELNLPSRPAPGEAAAW
jgi:hypothetical protein